MPGAPSICGGTEIVQSEEAGVAGMLEGHQDGQARSKHGSGWFLCRTQASLKPSRLAGNSMSQYLGKNQLILSELRSGRA